MRSIDPLWAARLHLATGTMLSGETVTAICKALVASHQGPAGGEHNARLAEREACAQLVNDWNGGLAQAMRNRGRHTEINPGDLQGVAIERNGRNQTKTRGEVETSKFDQPGPSGGK